MADPKTFKVHIGQVMKDVTVNPPTGRDQRAFLKSLNDIKESDDPEAFIKALDNMLMSITGLNEEEVLDMHVADKDMVEGYIMETHMNFAKRMKDFLKN